MIRSLAFGAALLVATTGVSSAAAQASPPGRYVLLETGAATARIGTAMPLVSAAAPPFVLAADSLNLEDKEGYSTEYIFGLSKGTMRSTLVPALKPFVLIFTVPLDLALLPFAAIAGAF